jgi:hypothetical protein
MAFCTGCNDYNEYQDKPFLCYVCRGGSVIIDDKPKQLEPPTRVSGKFKYPLGSLLVNKKSERIVIMAYAQCPVQGYKYIYVEKDIITDIDFDDLEYNQIIDNVHDISDPAYKGRYNAWTVGQVEAKYFVK